MKRLYHLAIKESDMPSIELIISTLLGLVVTEFTELSPWLASKLLALVVRCLPLSERYRFAQEWKAELENIPGKVTKLLFVTRLLATMPSTRVALGEPAFISRNSGIGRLLQDHVYDRLPNRGIHWLVITLGMTLLFVGFVLATMYNIPLPKGVGAILLTLPLGITSICGATNAAGMGWHMLRIDDESQPPLVFAARQFARYALAASVVVTGLCLIYLALVTYMGENAASGFANIVLYMFFMTWVLQAHSFLYLPKPKPIHTQKGLVIRAILYLALTGFHIYLACVYFKAVIMQ
jgi:hypothetical protein